MPGQRRQYRREHAFEVVQAERAGAEQVLALRHPDGHEVTVTYVDLDWPRYDPRLRIGVRLATDASAAKPGTGTQSRSALRGAGVASRTKSPPANAVASGTGTITGARPGR
jgi:hypothetical protein